MKKLILASLTVMFFAAGCTLPWMGTPGNSPAPATTPVMPEKPDGPTRQKIAVHVRAEHYSAALSLIRAERERRPDAFTEEYLQVLKQLAADADRLFAEDEMAQAGTSLRTILDYFPMDSIVLKRFERSRQEFELSLKTCSDRLLERGLVRYRTGDLSGAIAAWQQILTFAPDNEVALRNIRTAEVQLKKLRSLP